jgi:hypothetical protein
MEQIIQNHIHLIYPYVSQKFLPMGFLVSTVAVVEIVVACLVFTLCSEGLFQGFGREYCLHIQGD